jgi:hypothetical protein
MYIKSESIVNREQLESDRYFIMIEDERSSVKTPREPVCPVTCPVRVPVRTGLKRKGTVRQRNVFKLRNNSWKP